MEMKPWKLVEKPCKKFLNTLIKILYKNWPKRPIYIGYQKLAVMASGWPVDRPTGRPTNS